MTVGEFSSDLPPVDAPVVQFWRRHRRTILPLLVLLILLSFWEYAARAGMVSKLVLAPPSAIVPAMFREWPLLLDNSGVTLLQAMTGFAIGNSLGLLAAIVFIHSDLARRIIYPLAIGAEAVPVVAVVPVLILWLGNGMEPKIFIAAFLSFFPMLVNAFRGLRSADAEVSELMFTLAASPRQRLLLVRLPAALPFVFNALKFSACGAVVASLVAEWLASDRGLGYLIIFYGQTYRIAEVWAAALVASAASMALYGAVALLEVKLTPWLRLRRSILD